MIQIQSKRPINGNPIWVCIVLLFVIFVSCTCTENRVNFLEPFPFDEHAVLLMHFDSNLVNQSSYSGGRNSQGSIQFVQGLPGLGHAVWIDNSRPGEDTSMIIIPPADALDLKTTFTIEGWANTLSFHQAGEGSTASRLNFILRKGTSGDGHDFAYAVSVNPFTKCFDATSVYTDFGPGVRIRNESWNHLSTMPNTVSPGTWYHFVFIKDFQQQAKVLLVHDTKGRLIRYNGALAPSDTTAYNREPLYLGLCNISRQDEGVVYWDGYLDDLRISDIVRDYSVPPLIGNVKLICSGINPKPGEPVRLIASVGMIGNNRLRFVPVLHWQTGNGAWKKMKMQRGEDPGSFYLDVEGHARGTTVKYFITAKNQDGLAGRYPQPEEEFAGFGYWDRPEQTLYLDFEEGPDHAPVDRSEYVQQVIAFGNIEHSELVPPPLAGRSKWSLAFNLRPPQTFGTPDSSGIMVPGPAPFINGEYDSSGRYGWMVDFWLRTDPDHPPGKKISEGMTLMYTGLLTTQVSGNLIQRMDILGDNTFLVRFFTPFTTLRLRVPGISEGKEWIHARIGDAGDYYFARFRDESDSLLTEGKLYKSQMEPFQPRSGNLPLIIGYSWSGSAFRGWLDEIRWYNYAELLSVPEHE